MLRSNYSMISFYVASLSFFPFSFDFRSLDHCMARLYLSVALAFTGRYSHSFTVSSTAHRASFLRMSSTGDSTKKKVLVPIADGSEEIETTCITDTLVRFGADVSVASVMPGELVCTMSRGIKIMADMTIDDASKQEWDLIALPGGMPGAEHLRDCDKLISMLEHQKKEGKLYGAVCASPAVVLASKGLAAEGATCYPAPGFRGELKSPVDDEVSVTGNLTTSQGPGTSLKFALQLGENLYGKQKADEVAAALLVTR